MFWWFWVVDVLYVLLCEEFDLVMVLEGVKDVLVMLVDD